MNDTQEKWEIDRHDDNNEIVIRSANGDIVANLECDKSEYMSDEKIHANAKLIAAAPETKRQRDELRDIMVSIERYTHSDASPKCIIDLIRLSAKGAVEATN